MKPLVSGAEAKRYETLETGTYLLFPYERDERGNMTLISPVESERRFASAWSYLRSYEKELRAREGGKFNDADWYRFGRNQNIDKQDRRKLIVPRLVSSLCCSYDAEGSIWLDNVDAGGVLSNEQTDPYFLLAALNGPIADFVFRRISKPFQNGYWSANKQFIAPLPIPRADAKTQAAIGVRARELQERWTHRRQLLEEAEARLSTLGRARHASKWLWPDLPSIATLKENAPRSLRANEKTDWAHVQLTDAEDRRIEELQGNLDSGNRIEAGFSGGELKLFSGGASILDRIFLDKEDGRLAEAFWRFLILNKSQRDAKSFASSLRRPPNAPDSPGARQFVEKVSALAALTESIRDKEREMNEILFDLYRLSDDERLLVERDCALRPVL